VAFLQNHDQVGNRALGERLAKLVKRQEALDAAIALLLLAPQIPMIFMGEEFATDQPFLYFTAHHDELAGAVRDGRRREFARFAAFHDPAAQARIPDPNDAETFTRSRLSTPCRGAGGGRRLRLYQDLLRTRDREIAPALDGTVALGADAIGAAAVRATWRLGDGRILQVLCNLGSTAVAVPPLTKVRKLAAVPAAAAAEVASGNLPACAIVWHIVEATS
jgi:maltooligosyltrehalose trehalohydrolase